MTEIERFLSDRVRESWSPGISWWVERDGVALDRGACGLAAAAPHSVPVSDSTLYDLASLTKPLATALLLSLLAHDGALDLDDPAERWAPELGRSCAGRADLRALARHEAGLPPWRPLYLEAEGTEAVLRAIGRVPVAVDPGTILYSDLGYIVLGAILERVSGHPLGRLFHERVALPLGLERAGFAGAGSRLEDAAATEDGNAYERAMAGEAGTGHPWRAGVISGEVHDANAWALGGAAGHAGLFGTAREVARIAREILRPEILPLARAERNDMLHAGGSRRTVGFDVAVRARAARGILPPAAPGHTGFTGTSVWIDPDLDAVYVLLANRVHPRVPRRDFGWLRRGFHRLARRATVRIN